MLSPAKSTGNLIITAPSVCGWQADADVTWFTVTSAASGSGSKTFAYSVPANNTGQRRTGTLTVGGIALGIAASLFKGADYEEATLLALLLVVLWRARPAFDRRAALVDTRFSADKRPYKTHAGMWFFHAATKATTPSERVMTLNATK